MILVDREPSNSLDSMWHLNTHWLRWPVVDFVQMRFLDEDERICRDYVKLESEMFPTKQ